MMITNEERELREALSFTDSVVPQRISADAEIVENGLAKLVLSIIEMKLEEKMAELKVAFGLSDEQLNMKLGPLKMWDQ